MGRRPRRTFTDEFKAEAVRIARERGSIGKAAKELSLTEGSLREWVRRAEEGILARGGSLELTEREELQRLRREVKTLRMEREFLKKAAAFFAKEPK